MQSCISLVAHTVVVDGTAFFPLREWEYEEKEGKGTRAINFPLPSTPPPPLHPFYLPASTFNFDECMNPV